MTIVKTLKSIVINKIREMKGNLEVLLSSEPVLVTDLAESSRTARTVVFLE